MSLQTEDRIRIENHLKAQYEGVFTPEALRNHLSDYAETSFAQNMLEWVQNAGTRTGRLLDVGSGYGSFVLLAREAGIEACGIEIAEFEVEIARKRLSQHLPAEQPERVYFRGSALELPFEDSSFDTVTLWNVLEHVPDFRKAIDEARRILRPGGSLFVVCPNYAAFRREAHYHVFWPPFVPKGLGILYLTLLGKKADFYRDHIYNVTNWGVLFALHKAHFRFHFPEIAHIENRIKQHTTIRKPLLRLLISLIAPFSLLTKLAVSACLAPKYLSRVNPFKNSVVLHLVKHNLPK